MYSWVDHTSELELRIEAESLDTVFRDALAAIAELVGDEQAGPPAEHEISLAERDAPALLVQWLEELVFLAETRGLVPESLAGLDVTPTSLRATVRGHRGDPPHLVNAVTYHGLELERENDRWHARVVLDV